MFRRLIKRPSNFTIFMVMVAAFVIMIVGVSFWLSIESQKDGKLRDAAIAVRAEEAARATNGVVVIEPNAPRTPYLWSGETNTLTVTVTIGSCTNLTGYVSLPEAPNGLEGVGELKVMVPSAGDNPSMAHVNASDPSLFAKLLESGYSHCVAGDTRITGK